MPTDTQVISKLKNRPWVAYVLNKIMLSNIAKTLGLVSWNKPKKPNNFQKQLVADAKLKETLMQLLQTGEITFEELSKTIHMLIHSNLSKLSLAKQHSESLTSAGPNMNSYIDLFKNASNWFAPDQHVPTPTFKKIRRAVSLETIYVVVAAVEAMNALGLTNIRSDDPSKLDDAYHKAILAKLKNVLKLAKGVMPTGKTAKEACETAIKFVETAGKNPDVIKRFLDYESLIPNGSQIAYQMMNGYFHHGVYLESSAVVEVMNLDAGSVQSFITISDILAFFKRARNNPSDVYVFEYENNYPVEIIKKRALWSLGKYPNYHLTNENCESFASWVLCNQFESSLCLMTKNSTYNGINRELRLNAELSHDLVEENGESMPINLILENNESSLNTEAPSDLTVELPAEGFNIMKHFYSKLYERQLKMPESSMLRALNAMPGNSFIKTALTRRVGGKSRRRGRRQTRRR